MRRILYISSLAFLALLDFLFAQQAVQIEVDATRATGRIFHSRMLFPVKPGPLTLYYPKWFPGTHAPTGQLTDMVGLKMSASGRTIPWTRDPVDMFAFHVHVPESTEWMEIDFDFVVPTSNQAHHHPSAASEHAAMISWTSLLLYPQEQAVDEVMYQPVLRLPKGWKYGTALQTMNQSENKIEFSPVSLYTLIDSPVAAGDYFQTLDLNPGSEVPYKMHLAADSKAALEVKPEVLSAYRKLIGEARALFGSIHHRQYHFLVTLSDPLSGEAVEHHESSDNRPPERMFLDDDPYRYWADTLAHELVHSWNGKYRRPAGLNLRNYQEPVQSELLWVYEGLTQYLGYVLAARSGLLTANEFRDATAWLAAGQEHRTGRSWRPLMDTAAGAQVLLDAEKEWENWRRRLDYYNEGFLIWLEVDSLIREQSGGTASLNDFCRKFFGGKDGPPAVNPYTLDDIVATLNEVFVFEWKTFFISHVNEVRSNAPLGGLERSGWKLAYTGKMTPYHQSAQNEEKEIDLRFSVGLIFHMDGKVKDVVPGKAAAEAGVAPGMKVLGVNGRRWSEMRMREGVRVSKTSEDDLELLVENGDFYKTLLLRYHEGEKYPVLEKDPAKDDLLEQIIKPML